MANYKYKQESGANFYVSAVDMADALEDTNNIRQIVNDLGTILAHSKQDGLYPNDATTGGTMLLVPQYGGTGVANDVASTITIVGAHATQITVTGATTIQFPTTGTLASLDDLSGSAATGTTLLARATEDIKKGQAVYISGSTGAAYPNVSLCDADDSDKIRMIGMAAGDINTPNRGLIRVQGLVLAIDSLGATDVNPNDEAWAAGDLLYVELDGSGGYTNIRPTSGRVILAGYTLYGASNTDVLLSRPHPNPINLSAAVGEIIRMRLGAADGTTKITIKDYADVEVASINDDGEADFTSLTLDNPLLPAEGGTGVANGANNTLTYTGNFTLGLTLTANTAVTLPTSGTLYGTKADSITSAQMLSSVSDETGTGKLVFATSPTFITPLLGTPTSGVVTNLSGAFTGVTSMVNAALYVGRDADNTINFATDNHIIFKTNGATGMEIDSTGELDMNANSIGFTLQTDSGTGAQTLDWKLGNKFQFTFGAGNVVFTFTAPTNPCTLTLELIQDGTGSRTCDYPATVMFPSGTKPTLSTDADAKDIISLFWNGTNYLGTFLGDFSVPV